MRGPSPVSIAVSSNGAVIDAVCHRSVQVECVFRTWCADSETFPRELMIADPRDTIADSPMSPLQVMVVAITVALNALDGFDVLSISFASPGIAAEWGIDRAQLGIVLSMQLIGMPLECLLRRRVSHPLRRRPTIPGCLGT